MQHTQTPGTQSVLLIFPPFFRSTVWGGNSGNLGFPVGAEVRLSHWVPNPIDICLEFNGTTRQNRSTNKRNISYSLNTNHYPQCYNNQFKQLFGILAFATVGLGYFLINRLTRPDIHWTKTDSEPWNKVKEDATSKIYNPNGNFKSYWYRFGFGSGTKSD